MKPIIISSFALVAAAWMALGASAEVTGVAFSVDEPWTVTDTHFSGTITLAEAGDLYCTTDVSQYSYLQIDGVPASFHCYDAESGGLSHLLRWKNLSAGTHTVSSTWGDTGATLLFYRARTPEMVNVKPNADSVVATSVNNTGDILISLNMPFTYSNAYLIHETGVKSASLGASASEQTTQGVRVRNAMNTWYQNGTFDADGGDMFFVCLEGVSVNGELVPGEDENEEGFAYVTYIAAPRALQLVNTTCVNGSTFYSYYPEGDSRAIYTLTFDGDVCTDAGYAPVASIGIGDIESENGYYFENVPVQVSGKTITVDLSGKNRREGIKQCGEYNGQAIALKIANIFDNHHFLAQGLTDGTLGSVSHWMTYSEIPETPVDFTFTPENGSSLNGVSQLKLWYNNTQIIDSFEGLEFAYEDGTRDLIPAASLVNELADTEARYTVSVPSRARTEAVTVSLAKVVSLDGYDKHITATYNTLTVIYSSPIRAFGSYESIGATDVMSFEINYAYDYDDMDVAYAITDLGNGLVLAQGSLERNKYDEYEGTTGSDLVFYLGHSYALTLTCNSGDELLGTVAVPFSGATRPAAYSSIEFVSVTPDGGQLNSANRTITVEYSGDVAINSATTGWLDADRTLQRFESTVGVDRDGTDNRYARSWAFTLPEDALQVYPTLTLHVGAIDSDPGNPATVRGDLNTDDATDVKVFSYATPNPESVDLPTVEVTTADGPDGVYTIQGVRLPSADNLPAGLYIIDGHKKVVK